MSLSRRESWSADRDRCGAAWAGPSEIVGGGSILCSSRCAFCISRGAFRPRDVRFALENDGWNCTFECEVHVSASEGAQEDVAAGPMATTADTPAGPPGRSGRPPRPPPDSRRPSRARGGAVCPNLLQRPGSSRGAGGESLIFRASSRGRSGRGAPLQQIRTRPRPGPPQEPHPHHLAPARPRHHDDPGPRTAAPGEKVSVNDPKIGSS